MVFARKTSRGRLSLSLSDPDAPHPRAEESASPVVAGFHLSRDEGERERGGRLSWVASRPRHAAVIIGSLFTACYTLR